MKLPMQLNTRRSHKIIQFFLERSKNWDRENRDLSIYWSVSHMTTTAQIMRLLAVCRGLDADFSAIAGALHDIATMESGKQENHAARAVEYLDALISEYNSKYEKYKITYEELQLLKEIIPQHSSKEEISDNVYAELLKDADAVDRYLQGVETKEAEVSRLLRALSELGINAEF